MRVLYVDDDPSMTAAVERMFTSEDFQCDTSALGEAAVDLAKQNAYDIILLDVMLPDIDGYEVITRLRAAGVHTPVLLQSGLVDRESDIDGLWLGASDYLLKPFTKRELFERIQAILSRPADGSPQDPVHLSPSSGPSQKDRDRRRRHRRFETVQPGRILHNGGIDCLILNMSHGGAALQLFDPDADCPESFDLLLQSGAALRCHVRWRSADKIGVQGEALFPDKVVTDILKQGEAALSEPANPVVAPQEAENDKAVSSRMSADEPAQSSRQVTPTDQAAVDAPLEAGPKREGRPGGPAAPQPEAQLQPQQAEPDPPGQPEDGLWHADAIAQSGSEPATDQCLGEPPVPLSRESAAPTVEDPAVCHGEPRPPDQSEEAKSDDGKVFTVDHGTHLVAEACECEQIVVDGCIETAARARQLRVGREGRFVGSAEVESAEIRGHYEGDLTVSCRLVIRAGGTVSGTTRYREIVIEAGGGLLGQVQLLSRRSGGVAVRTEAEPRAAMSARQASVAHA